MRLTVPQLDKLPQQDLARVQEAVQVLRKDGVKEEVVNLKHLKQAVAVLEEYGFDEEVNLKKLSEVLDGMLLMAAPDPPARMTSAGEVTATMRQRQRRNPTSWALTMRQWFDVLTHISRTELYKELREKQMQYVSMYDINEHFVKRWTRGSGCGLSVLMTPDSSADATLMLSHAWAEDMEQMKVAVTASLEQRGLLESLDEIRVWFCVFANYQPEDAAGPTIQEQLELMPFKRVIESESVRLGHGMCAVHTSKADLYTRLWCVHEVAEAKETMVPISSAMSEEYAAAIVERMQTLFVYGCDDVECLRGTGILCNSSAARTSRPEDERNLISAIRAPDRGGFAALDEVVLQFRLQHLPPMVEAMVFFAHLRNRSISVEERRAVLQDREKLMVRMQALRRAEASGDLLESVVAVLVAQLDHQAKEIQRAVPEGLAAVASKVSEADVLSVIIPALQAKLSDQRADVRMAALPALPALAGGVSGEDVLAAMIQAIKPKLEDEHKPIRLAALAALAPVVRKVSAADVLAKLLPAVKAKLEDEEQLVRRTALEALAALASNASSTVIFSTVIPAVKAMLEEEHEGVVKAALDALSVVANLGQVSDEDATVAIIPAMTAKLAAEEWYVREAALKALAAVACRVNQAQAIAEVTAAIETRLQDEYSNVRREAVKALAAVAISLCKADAVAPIISAIQGALEDNEDDPDVRRAAVDALAAIAPSVTEAQVCER